MLVRVSFVSGRTSAKAKDRSILSPSEEWSLHSRARIWKNAENGNSYRTFAVWKPEAARSTYIHDDELSEKYHAVTPGKARDWWIKKHATVPPIETHDTHIIGGAIIPHSPPLTRPGSCIATSSRRTSW